MPYSPTALAIFKHPRWGVQNTFCILYCISCCFCIVLVWCTRAGHNKCEIKQLLLVVFVIFYFTYTHSLKQQFKAECFCHWFTAYEVLRRRVRCADSAGVWTRRHIPPWTHSSRWSERSRYVHQHYQCPNKADAVDAAALGPSRNRPTATDEKKKSFLFWMWFIRLVQFRENH